MSNGWHYLGSMVNIKYITKGGKKADDRAVMDTILKVKITFLNIINVSSVSLATDDS